ncbi:MAG: hypothetical protein CVV18_02355 [Gammaproteobacteria bacterium HGW-Gammaproteobacteria-8]|nr:MAG: hypothetical protein CVV18_02355 [Gammaproteobacteria bacterium HGW-Gammaproteobacteria-8]
MIQSEIRPIAIGSVLFLALAGNIAAEVAEPVANPVRVLQQAVANSHAWMQVDLQRPLEYQQTVEIDDGEALRQEIRQIDERRPPEDRVRLVSVDRQSPDPKALEKFRKQQEENRKRADDDRRGSISFEHFDLTDARLLEHDGEQWLFEVPRAVSSMLGENNAAMAEHLRMQVEVDPAHPAGPYLTRLTVESTAAFKPGLIGKVERFRVQMNLTLHDSGRLVMDRMDVDIRARAMFRNIESRQTVAFSGYREHLASTASTAD